MKIKNSLTGILLLFVVSHVFAAKPVVANLQSSAELKLVGQAQMRWLMFPLYNVSLKTSDGSYQENRYPQMLDILYLRNINKQDLLAATDNQWARLGIPKVKRNLWIGQLGKLWPTIRKGDRLAFQVNQDGYNYFIYNGKRIGGVSDKQFGKSFLDIWLSPRTSQPGIRQRLIG